VAHSAMCKQYSKYYRNIDMEISLDVSHRVNIMILIKKCRQEYDRFLDEAPDIPSISIKAFNEAFPSKENKPDVCNGLSVIGCDDTHTKTSTNNIVSRWLGSLSSSRRKSTDGAPRSVV
jgi:hypothetical protein